MTTTDQPTINGHRVNGQVPSNAFVPPQMSTPLYATNPQPQPAAGDPQLSVYAQLPAYPQAAAVPSQFGTMPSAAELEQLQQRAAAAGTVQDADEIRSWKSWEEIEADRKLAQEHRAAMRKVEAERNAFEVEQARRQLSTQKEISAAQQRDQLDAIKAKDKLRTLSSPVAFLAAQYRSRKLALNLAASPAVAGVLIGTVQAQDAWAHVMHLSWTNPVWWVLFLLESLATAPLIGILIFQAGRPGGSASAIRRAFAEMRTEKFAGIKALLLGISVFINVAPHLFLAEWSGLIWLWVPVAVVLSLWLLPVLAAEFNERILTAKTDTELSVPAGTLSPDESKLIRQMRAVDEAELTGSLRPQDGEVTAGAGAIRKALASAFGSAGMPDAQKARDGLRLYRTGEA